ncbi:methyl-accepting chemotaxis protein [Desulfitispora alkaliphila]|uniref:methyl-accepting chemotaxis protein n=1 Tax=Desulfitispora alkaliphila TaxID=622674 RepID=UPI003D1F7C9A
MVEEKKISWWNKQGLTFKFIGSFVVILAFCIGIGLTLLVDRQSEQPYNQEISRMRTITQKMDITRDYFNDMQDAFSSLGESRYDTVTTVPMVAAVITGQEYGQRAHDGMVVRTPTDQPRNPNNQADQWELKMLKYFRENPEETEITERYVMEGENVLRFAAPVKVTQDCMECHGFPVGESDPYGYAKEGYTEGDIRALYSLYLPTASLEAQNRENAMLLYSLGIIMGLLILVATYALIKRLVAKPVDEMTSSLSEMNKGSGDLTKRIDVSSQDEVGQLGNQFNTFVEQLAGMIRQVDKTSKNVAEVSSQVAEASYQTGQATEQVAINIEQLADNSAQQAQGISASSEEVQGLAQASEQVSDNAVTAAQLSKDTAKEAGRGQDYLQNAVGRMRSLNDTVDNAADLVNTLGQRGQEIGQIVEMIQNIADQTNLLALNAAIEAARAGEQGKGFAVVADEVRKLAEESSKATGQITEMIIQIQEETTSAVKAMNAGTEEVDQGVEIIGEANQALEGIVKAAQQTDAEIQSISAAAKQLAEGSDRVARTMEEISVSAQEVSSRSEGVSAAAEEQTAAVEEISASAQSLASSADELKELVNRFKI